jgi:outer membrane protein OmpA-like peptidoglycan-associated protein
MTVVNTHRNIPVTPSSVTINVNFLEASDTILPDFYRELEKLGTLLTDPGFQEMRLQIAGHTDNTGSDAYNEDLSLRRARSVKQYLVEHWPIQPERIQVRGYGKRHPTATNETVEGRWTNRRVEVKGLE